MTKAGRVLTAAMAAALLGGCQSIFGQPLFGLRAASPERQLLEFEAEAGRYAAEQLHAGRRLLDLGHYGLALEAFRKAAIGPEQRAAAHNGLAVAYAQIGRPDLAERYFRSAIQAAPADQRYAANLSRLFASMPPRVTQLTRLAGLQPLAMPAAPSEPVAVETGSARLVRTSGFEVRIISPGAEPTLRRTAGTAASSITASGRLNPRMPRGSAEPASGS